jgi:hypothetical protein
MEQAGNEAEGMFQQRLTITARIELLVLKEV